MEQAETQAQGAPEPSQWGRPIAVDGKRPKWLTDDDTLVSWTNSRGITNTATAALLSWAGDGWERTAGEAHPVVSIRLPEEHPYYATADRARARVDAFAAALAPPLSFQERVRAWVFETFGERVAMDWIERNHRFLEEALELVQSAGCTSSEANQLVDYVFDRPKGEKAQELGGVMVTLAALCHPHQLDMLACGEAELARVWTMVDKIRAKQAAKPKHSPLPGPSA